MLVYRGFSRISPDATVLTIGNFDGVHLGHRALLARLKAIATEQGVRSTVLTFEPHPRDYFLPEKAPARLTTLREKLELIADDGIDAAYVGHFNAGFAALLAAEFIERILVRTLRVKYLIIGDDFRFGADRQGDFDMLQAAGDRFGFQVEAMGSVTVDGVRASSSAVRTALADGRMEHAAHLLGRPYSIDGRVVHGDKVGRQLGFATANIRIKHDRPPLLGVFAVAVRDADGRSHDGVANLGFRPSVNQTPKPLLEVHLLNFSSEIYGHHLNVRFLHKLRDEMKFPNFEALKAQIASDVEAAIHYFKH